MPKPEKQLDAPKAPSNKPKSLVLSGQAWQAAQVKALKAGIGPMKPNELPDQYYQRIQEALTKEATFPQTSPSS